MTEETLPRVASPHVAWLQGALAASEQLDVGQGTGPVHHFHALWSGAGAVDPEA